MDIHITYYVDVAVLGDDITKNDERGYFNWLAYKIADQFPQAHIVTVSDEHNDKRVHCTERSLEHDVITFANAVHGECPWHWAETPRLQELFVQKTVARVLTDVSDIFLLEIIEHGIHNITNDFHGNNEREYNIFEREFYDQALAKFNQSHEG